MMGDKLIELSLANKKHKRKTGNVFMQISHTCDVLLFQFATRSLDSQRHLAFLSICDIS